MPINQRSIRKAQSVPAHGEMLEPTPRQPGAEIAMYRIRLSSPADLRRELARLYREARCGAVEPQDATRLAYLLDLLRKAMESEAIGLEATSLNPPCGRFRFITGDFEPVSADVVSVADVAKEKAEAPAEQGPVTATAAAPEQARSEGNLGDEPAGQPKPKSSNRAGMFNPHTGKTESIRAAFDRGRLLP